VREPQTFFAADSTVVESAIIGSKRLTPAMTGTLVYLNLGTVENLEQALGRVDSL